MFLDFLLNWLTNDVAIDLGTANTLVYLKGHGVVVNEPSVVAVETDSKKIIAVGNRAKEMLGKTPEEIKAIKPMKDGVIANFEITETMLRHLILKSQQKKFLIRPRVIVAVPSGITEVEKRAVKESAERAGARKVFLVSEPLASAIGVGLPVHEPHGNMIIDIGGGTTEIAIISLSHIVDHNSIRIGGDEMDEAVVAYLRRKHSLYIGESTAERIKMKIGSAFPLDNELTMEVRGRDLISGYPVSMKISSEEVREGISETVIKIVDAVKRLFEETAPELSADIADRGVVLTGGAGQLMGLDKKIQETINLPVTLVDNPLTSVVMGCGKILDNLEEYEKVLLPDV
ncbi:MAG TPA: rod shape-determining protein [Candidatus Cloacimonetes bacterium]|nr:rod shape-determining protein [Candidatus Cloacimonadota bacterium]